MADIDTIYGLISDAARRLDRPLAVAAKQNGSWEPISHAALIERVDRIAAGLYDLGVRKGDRVALLAESSPTWTAVDLATMACGAALVPIYPTLTDDQVAHIVKDSGARVAVVSDARQLAKVRPLVDEAPALEQLVVIETAGADDEPLAIALDAVETRGTARLAETPDLVGRLANEVGPDDLATLIYTSGTTGTQKGVMLTHGNFIANIDATFNKTRILGDDDVALSYLPLSHIFERTAIYGFLHTGVAVYYSGGFDRVAAEFKEVRPTVATSVPRLFEKMYAKICDTGAAAGGLRTAIFNRSLRCGDRYARASHDDGQVPPLLQLEYDLLADRLLFRKWRDALGGRVRYFISGGAPLAPDIAYAFLGAQIPIFEGYGLTETSPVISINHPGSYRIGTVGKPLANLEVRIEPDGEICVRGPSIMQGYYNLPEQTRDAFTEDGYFRTGDIGHLDADGFLKITDRKKDLLKTSGGKYVAPQPIENALKASSLIAQAVVIGDRRKFCSALIVPNVDALGPALAARGIKIADVEDVAADPRVVAFYQETVNRLTPNLAKFEQIKKVALLPRELTIESGEMTPTLKVKRRVVEDRYKDLIEAMYVESGEREAAVHG